MEVKPGPGMSEVWSPSQAESGCSGLPLASLGPPPTPELSKLDNGQRHPLRVPRSRNPRNLEEKMEMVAHLQVFPLPSGNTKRSEERKKKRGVRKRGTPLSQPPSALGKLSPPPPSPSHMHLGVSPDPCRSSAAL